MEKEKAYDHSIDFLRVLAISSVVLIHTTTLTLEKSGYALNDFSFSLFLNQSSRFAVVMFFIISGFVLERNREAWEGYFNFIKKRLLKIAIPYIFWSTIYYFFMFPNYDSFQMSLIYGSASYQLYFIPALFMFYLLFPVIEKVKKYLFHPVVFMLLFLIQLAFLYYDYYIKTLPLAFPVSVAILNFFAFLFGVYFAKHKDHIFSIVSRSRKVILLILMFLVVYIYYEGKIGYLKTHDYLAFYSQWRPSVFIYSLILTPYLMFKLSVKEYKLKLLEKSSKLSFFVFFAHIFVLFKIWDSFGKYWFSKIIDSTLERILFDLLQFTIVLSISFLIGSLTRKIPKLVKITG